MKPLSRTQIIDLINKDQAIIIYENNVLNLTPWLPYHPGGEKAVLHMIGRDATDEMNAYHSNESIAMFSRYRIGNIDYQWQNLLPPIQGADYVGHSKTTDSLDNKLDNDNLELDICSTNSTNTSFSDKLVSPKVPQNIIITESNKQDIFPLYKDQTIVNPKLLMEKYDNELTHEDLTTFPSLDSTTQSYIRDEYHKLHAEVIRRGLYKCDYSNYVREVIKLSSMMLFSLSFYKLGWYITSAIILGLTWQQGTFIAHDAGHISITHDYQIDTLFGIFIADFFGGLSIGWWKKNHNVHHLVPNDPIHDPDIQHLPFFAVSTRLFSNVYSTYYNRILDFDKVAQFLIPFQKYLYYIILGFGRFNLYRLSWTYLIMRESPKKGKGAWFRYWEFAGLSFFAYWYVYLLVFGIESNWGKFNYMLVSNMASFIVHVQITLSHFAMSTSDLGVSESFPMRQLRTTMDVDCPQWLDFFHGGLQFQAIHHLFPRMPRHNFRKCQPLVLQFCDKVGLKYSIYGFGQGNEIVISKLADIGKQCSIMLDATKKFSIHEMM